MCADRLSRWCSIASWARPATASGARAEPRHMSAQTGTRRLSAKCEHARFRSTSTVCSIAERIDAMPVGEASPFRVEPFSIRVDAAVIDDLRARIRNTRLPEAASGEPWAQGTDRDWLAGLLEYWADRFDWLSAERELNGFAQYRAQIGEAVVHFAHERARHGRGIPLVLGHGWPSAFAELLPVARLLADPGAHGIGGPAFDVVVPSLPGYGFSPRPAVAGGVGSRARLPAAVQVVGRDRAGLHGDPVDQAADSRLRAERLTSRACRK